MMNDTVQAATYQDNLLAKKLEKIEQLTQRELPRPSSIFTTLKVILSYLKLGSTMEPAVQVQCHWEPG